LGAGDLGSGDFTGAGFTSVADILNADNKHLFYLINFLYI